MTSPQRVRLSRAKGYRKPPDAIVVARPTKWGNPFPLAGEWAVWMAVATGHRADTAGRRASALGLHRAWLLGEPIASGRGSADPQGGAIVYADGTEAPMSRVVEGFARWALSMCDGTPTIPDSPLADIRELTGHDLACWCPLDQPCHADLLLQLANHQMLVTA